VGKLAKKKAETRMKKYLEGRPDAEVQALKSTQPERFPLNF